MEDAKVVPVIEDEICKLLAGDVRKIALEFAAYLNENNMTPRRWFCPTIWRIPYGENYLGGIFLNRPGKFRIYFFRDEYRGSFDGAFLKCIHGHVAQCIDCGGECPKGETATVFGKSFENTCFQFPIQFEDPSQDTLEHIKTLLDYWKGVAPRSDAWHVR